MFSAIIGGIEAGKRLYDSVTGDDKVSGPCPGQLTATEVRNIRRYAPPHRTNAAKVHWESNASRPPFHSADPARIARWMSGGDDCHHDDPTGRHPGIQADWEGPLRREYGSGPPPVATQPAQPAPDYWSGIDGPPGSTNPDPSSGGYIQGSAGSSSGATWILVLVILVAFWAATKVD